MRQMLHLLRPRTSTAAGLYQYHTGSIFVPGADINVFEPSFGLPLFIYRGHGVQAGNSPNPIQGPQIYAYNPKPVAGFGGIVAGQFMPPGPLLDNSEQG